MQLNKKLTAFLAFTLATTSSLALCGKHSVVADIVSYHSNTTYDNNNYGLGYMCELQKNPVGVGKTSLGVGAYRNSFGDFATYYGADFGNTYGKLSYGVMGGIVTGYEHAVTPMGFARVGYEVVSGISLELLVTDDHPIEDKHQATTLYHFRVKVDL